MSDPSEVYRHPIMLLVEFVDCCSCFIDVRLYEVSLSECTLELKWGLHMAF